MDLDDTLIALADETRRDILKRLAAGDARVTEIAAPDDEPPGMRCCSGSNGLSGVP